MRQLNISHNVAYRDPQVDKYLTEIAKHELISAEKEAELARKIRNGDHDALEELVNANLRFVVSVAKQYQNQGLALSDLINEGNLGLMRAAYKFDETRGFKFISYAVWWIRQAIMQAIVEQSRVIRLPQHKLGAYTKITRAFQSFEQEFQREPDVEELMEMLGMSKEEIDEYFRLNTHTISVDAPMRGVEAGTLKETLADNDHTSADEEIMNETVVNELNSAIAQLSERESEIISSYFGLNGKAPMTLEEIGIKFNLTRERVRQIKEKCIQRLKTSSHVNNLHVFLEG
ncbi:MAG: sigma-70 family RNA polymerase sigma factor [Bacteroidetes bacterium]|nr:sigma-70 family RNA polymerase sigma factor [Bacteroidota bacterium]MBK8659600.1 sigma-70 family RNA polymerase sigma factor [Bacteroidota bacterium]